MTGVDSILAVRRSLICAVGRFRRSGLPAHLGVQFGPDVSGRRWSCGETLPLRAESVGCKLNDVATAHCHSTRLCTEPGTGSSIRPCTSIVARSRHCQMPVAPCCCITVARTVIFQVNIGFLSGSFWGDDLGGLNVSPGTAIPSTAFAAAWPWRCSAWHSGRPARAGAGCPIPPPCLWHSFLLAIVRAFQRDTRQRRIR